jgi:hypothetical protein
VATRFLLGAGRASWMAPRAAEARHAGAMLEELRRDGPGARAGRHAGYRAPVAVPAYAAERTAGGGGDRRSGGRQHHPWTLFSTFWTVARRFWV